MCPAAPFGRPSSNSHTPRVPATQVTMSNNGYNDYNAL